MASSSSSSYINLVAVLLVLSSAATVLSTSHRDVPAPAPAVDCSGLILTMVNCLSFVSNGSKVDKPEGTCCSGLKTVLKTNAECLCDAFKSAAQLGVVLNISKAITLPSACKLSAASAAKCYQSIVPAAAPGAEAPVSSPTSIATAPTSSVGVNAPPPGNSASSSLISLPSLALATATALAASWCFV